jgi:hypothetical protein
MSAAYRAILHGDRLEWTGERPAHPEDGLTVEVTVIGANDAPANGLAMAASLEAMARAGMLLDVADPVAWQRAARADRPLPGRDA